MDITSLVTIIGQLATLITIVLVYFTLVEMRNQRKASQKPDLLIPKASIYGYVNIYKGKQVFVADAWSDNKDIKDGEGHVWSETPIKIYNVGFGVAKNIELVWKVNYDKTLQQIKDYCYQNSVPIILQMEGDIVRFQADAPFSLSPQTFKHEFLMPASITSDGLATYVPPAVRELISILIYLQSDYRDRNLNNFSQLEIEIPSMDIELKYNDLENSHYTKWFNVEFLVNGYSVYGSGEPSPSLYGLNQFFSGAFEFKSKANKE